LSLFRLPAKQLLYKNTLKFKVGEIHSLDKIKQDLLNLGYTRCDLIEGRGQFSLRGGIIEKLEKIRYIEINKKTQIITPTQKGENIYDIVNFSMPDMLNPKLTASWEKGLDMVAKKEIKPDEFMNKLENYINSKFQKLVVKM
jgi:transcription-repair coupling factor (superfamily II helicase)